MILILIHGHIVVTYIDTNDKSRQLLLQSYRLNYFKRVNAFLQKMRVDATVFFNTLSNTNDPLSSADGCPKVARFPLIVVVYVSLGAL